MRAKRTYRYRFTNDAYVALIVLHIVIGIFINIIPQFSKLYFSVVSVFFIFKVIFTPKHEKLIWILTGCAYLSAVESLFRMTGGGLFYEFSKYFVILLMGMGIFYDGVSGKGYPYFIYLILLVPSILVASTTLGYDLNFRTSVAFVLSGPVCLGISALYCYDKKVSKEVLLQILACMIYPVITMTVHLFLYNPSVKEVLTGTASSRATSGGFGPNQVATLLGLGMFALTVRFFMKSPSLFLKIFNLVLLAAVSFRALVTLSRGGVYGAIIMILAFLVVFYSSAKFKQKQQVIISALLLFFVAVVTWTISLNQSSGLVGNRYANENARGQEKDDASTGRVELFVNEFEGFQENPFLGVGASGMKKSRLESEGTIIASHNEISRLLSEHGMFGVLILMILILKPLDFRSRHHNNIFFYSFLGFWFATINHSAMRIAAPAFLYALSLLHVTHEKPPLHRKPSPKLTK
jgi:hypothetical protein